MFGLNLLLHSESVPLILLFLRWEFVLQHTFSDNIALSRDLGLAGSRLEKTAASRVMLGNLCHFFVLETLD